MGSRRTNDEVMFASGARRTSGGPVKATRGEDTMSDIDARRLLHELEVHQIELKMQNEELQHARIELEMALARSTELFDFAPIGYATVTPRGDLQEINRAGAQLLDADRENLVGTGFASRLAPDSQAPFNSLLGKVLLESGARHTCEVELARSGQPRMQLRLTATSLRREEQTILLAFEDITERKLHEEKLARTDIALREADRRKDEFLAVLSHELRNPLAPIRHSVYVLARAEPGGEQARKAQLTIDRQVTHLTRLIDDLLDVTRIARGKIELSRKRVELGALTRRTVEDHRASFESMGVELVARIDAEPLWVDADPVRICQVISNLLGNALKFTLRGGRVVTTLERRERRVMLHVGDNGIGIAPEVIGRLFTPFAQAPQTSERARGGLGLGLSMVKGLLELHGGSVNIASPGLGYGTEVTAFLPLAEAPRECQRSEPPPSIRSRRILIIEDNRDAAETLAEALRFNGHQVSIAHDGTRGLELAFEHLPEAVLCDIGLPGMDGYAVARAFRRERVFDAIVLIALSGYAQPDDLTRAFKAGFTRHLAKPASVASIERAMANGTRALRAGQHETN